MGSAGRSARPPSRRASFEKWGRRGAVGARDVAFLLGPLATSRHNRRLTRGISHVSNAASSYEAVHLSGVFLGATLSRERMLAGLTQARADPFGSTHAVASGDARWAMCST